jgi:DNA polymerase
VGLGIPSDPIDVMFVGEAPGPEEDREGVCFLGKAGELFEDYVQRFLPERTWVLTNAVRCFPGYKPNKGFEKPTVGTKKNPGSLPQCKPYLDAEVRDLNPKLIVAMGNYAIFQTTGLPLDKCKITKLQGTVQDSEWGIPVVPIFHPSWVMRDKTSRGPQYDALWERLIDVLDGKVKDVPGQWEWLEGDQIEEWYADERKRSRKCSESPALVYDLETTGLDPRCDAYRMVGYARDGERAVVHALSREQDVALHHQLLREAPRLIAHHSIFDMEWSCVRTGDVPQGLVIDTKALAFLHNENLEMALGPLTACFVPELAGFKRESESFGGPFADLPDHILARRCAWDCMATYRLAEVLRDHLSPELQRFYIEVVEPGLKTIVRMKARGWSVDQAALSDLLERAMARQMDLTDTCASHKDMRAFLLAEWERLGGPEVPLSWLGRGPPDHGVQEMRLGAHPERKGAAMQRLQAAVPRPADA